MTTAGSTVVFAGLAVVIALAGLSIVGIPMLTQMGLAAAFTVALSVLIAVILLPALLGFAKRRVLGSRIPGLRARPGGRHASAGERRAYDLTSEALGEGFNGPLMVVVDAASEAGMWSHLW